MDKNLIGVSGKLNGISDAGVHAAPKFEEDATGEKEHPSMEPLLANNCTGKQDACCPKTTNVEGKLHKARKGNPAPEKIHQTCTQPTLMVSDKQAVSNVSPSSNSFHSPILAKNPLTRVPVCSDHKKQFEEEDNEDDSWSAASSAAASVRTVRSVTVGTAPTFKSAERAEKRKEFFSKLEQKNRALEAERSQAQLRTKEEQEAAIRQLRKSMVVKANPVPSFYYDPPPPKADLKKLPLTRPKSPKLNRRRSCGDASRSSVQGGKHCVRVRQSFGGQKAVSVSSKASIRGVEFEGQQPKPKQTMPSKTARKPASEPLNNNDISVQS